MKNINYNMGLLPDYTTNEKAIITIEPIYSNLFEINFKSNTLLTERVVNYKLNTAKNKLSVTFHLNEDDLKTINTINDFTEVVICTHDKTGMNLMKMTMDDLKLNGYKIKTTYEEKFCGKITYMWLYAKLHVDLICK